MSFADISDQIKLFYNQGNTDEGERHEYIKNQKEKLQDLITKYGDIYNKIDNNDDLRILVNKQKQDFQNSNRNMEFHIAFMSIVTIGLSLVLFNVMKK